MADPSLQVQIDTLNQKLDLILEEIVAQRQKRESMNDLVADLSLIGKDAFRHTVTELDKAQVEVDGEAIARLLVRLVANLRNIDELLDTFESIHDFIKDAGPIAHQIGLDAVNKMAEFERKGYLDYLTQLGRVGTNVVEHFSVKDVSDLADNIVPILETIKRVTQPDMMLAINNAVAVYAKVDMQHSEEYSIWRLLRELRTPEMRRGMGFMVNLIKDLSKPEQINHT